MTAYTDFLAINAAEPSDRPRWLRWYPGFVEARLAALEEIARELELDVELKDQIASAKIEAAVNGIPEDEPLTSADRRQLLNPNSPQEWGL